MKLSGGTYFVEEYSCTSIYRKAFRCFVVVSQICDLSEEKKCAVFESGFGVCSRTSEPQSRVYYRMQGKYSVHASYRNFFLTLLFFYIGITALNPRTTDDQTRQQGRAINSQSTK